MLGKTMTKAEIAHGSKSSHFRGGANSVLQPLGFDISQLVPLRGDTTRRGNIPHHPNQTAFRLQVALTVVPTQTPHQASLRLFLLMEQVKGVTGTFSFEAVPTGQRG
jgi:hypothetical protein